MTKNLSHIQAGLIRLDWILEILTQAEERAKVPDVGTTVCVQANAIATSRKHIEDYFYTIGREVPGKSKEGEHERNPTQ